MGTKSAKIIEQLYFYESLAYSLRLCGSIKRAWILAKRTHFFSFCNLSMAASSVEKCLQKQKRTKRCLSVAFSL